MTLRVKHYKNAGGACSNRDAKGKEERRNIGILTSKWPRAFRAHPRRTNEVVLSWPKDMRMRDDALAGDDEEDDGDALEEEASTKTRVHKTKVMKQVMKQVLKKGIKSKVGKTISKR